MRPLGFITTLVVVVLFSVSNFTSTNAAGGKITVSSRMALGICEQRDEYIKSKKLVAPVKKLPPTTSALPCGWFRIQKCPDCDLKFKTCAEVAAGVKTVTESASGTGGPGTEVPGTGTLGTGGPGTGTLGTGGPGTTGSITGGTVPPLAGTTEPVTGGTPLAGTTGPVTGGTPLAGTTGPVPGETTPAP